MKEYLEERGLDDIRVEDAAPTDDEQWVEEEVVAESKASASRYDVFDGSGNKLGEIVAELTPGGNAPSLGDALGQAMDRYPNAREVKPKVPKKPKVQAKVYLPPRRETPVDPAIAALRDQWADGAAKFLNQRVIQLTEAGVS